MMTALMICGSLVLAAVLFWPSWWRMSLVAAFCSSPFMPRPAQIIVLSLVALAVLWQMTVKSRAELAEIRRPRRQPLP